MAEVATDHETIRRWAESKGGKPAAVDRTHKGGDVGIVRIMFPNNPQSEHGSLVEISWDEFFKQFDESNLALLYEKDSMFSKIVGRDTVERREHGDHDAARHETGRGQKGDDPKAGGADQNSKREAERPAGHGSGRSEEERSLKEREYRDQHGNVHHHTNTYVEQHGGGEEKDGSR